MVLNFQFTSLITFLCLPFTNFPLVILEIHREHWTKYDIALVSNTLSTITFGILIKVGRNCCVIFTHHHYTTSHTNLSLSWHFFSRLLAEGPRLGSVANQQPSASSGAAPVISNPAPSTSKGPLPQSAVPYSSFMQQPPYNSTVASGNQLTQLPPPGQSLPPIGSQLPPPPPYSTAAPEMASLYMDPSATATFNPQSQQLNGYTSSHSVLSDPGASAIYSMTQLPQR